MPQQWRSDQHEGQQRPAGCEVQDEGGGPAQRRADRGRGDAGGARLLTETGQQPRKGRAMTLYRAAEEFRAPLALLPYSDVRGFFELVDAGLRGLFLDGLGRLADRSGLRDWVVRLYRAGDGSTRLDLAPPRGNWDPAAVPRPAPPLTRAGTFRVRGGGCQVVIGGTCRSTPKRIAGHSTIAATSEITSDTPATLL